MGKEKEQVKGILFLKDPIFICNEHTKSSSILRIAKRYGFTIEKGHVEDYLNYRLNFEDDRSIMSTVYEPYEFKSIEEANKYKVFSTASLFYSYFNPTNLLAIKKDMDAIHMRCFSILKHMLYYTDETSSFISLENDGDTHRYFWEFNSNTLYFTVEHVMKDYKESIIVSIDFEKQLAIYNINNSIQYKRLLSLGHMYVYATFLELFRAKSSILTVGEYTLNKNFDILKQTTLDIS